MTKSLILEASRVKSFPKEVVSISTKYTVETASNRRTESDLEIGRLAFIFIYHLLFSVNGYLSCDSR